MPKEKPKRITVENYLKYYYDIPYEGTTSAGCDSTTYLYVIVTQTGTDDIIESANLQIYPNPTTGFVNIVGSDVIRVEVLDAVGRMVMIVENSNTIDMSSLSTGAYMLRISLPKGIALRKVVKK